MTFDNRYAGRRRRITLGRWPEWGLTDARERTKKLLRPIDRWHDTLEYVVLRRAAPGCKIDSGQQRIGGYIREDAEVVAVIFAGIPDSFGGKRMAIRVTRLVRAGLTPDWMSRAVPHCAPTRVRQNQHGTHVGTVFVGVERIRARAPPENDRPSRLPSHLAGASRTDRNCTTRRQRLVAGVRLGTG